ncbi:hypothetical protein COU15_00130 [Candidatus Kaiserbacteria bacterium CG10_big_fil_rev_8_21_14_0_10_45_20]|uniref:Uncharacterized protein n=1 Tax=Candidatus Kaiserbacteria bacterium CG10_big_fil_rev_8_21_14_0_10_45_20 TaxID=1974607 RepID=A0A2H0UGF9_9BACT|nr:MAG: hypothetical protein COU15_00130 [Candidatus Kaiserbacteria bacterium CG10_big_fil_rev_8_21_14_0_10_45_20]
MLAVLFSALYGRKQNIPHPCRKREGGKKRSLAVSVVSAILGIALIGVSGQYIDKNGEREERHNQRDKNEQ